METFSKHCRFILTCNYVEKVIDPIQSRCQTFQIVPPTKKDVAVQISKILASEQVRFEPQSLVPIVDSSYPDIRKIINTCQLNSSKGELKIATENILDGDTKSKLIEIIKSNDDSRNKYMKVRQTIADSRVQDFTDFYTYFYEKVDDYKRKYIKRNIIIIRISTQRSLVVDKEITFMAFMIQLLNLIK